MTYYKITRRDLTAAHGGAYTYVPGEWTPPVPMPVPCVRGYHLVEADHITDWPCIGMRVWEAQPGEIVIAHDSPPKIVTNRVRLTTEHPELVPSWWRDVEALVASIPDVPWFAPQGAPDPAWRVFATRDTAEDAAWHAAWHAAWGAAGNAAWHAAWGAAGNATWNAARNAAWNAARDTAQNAAGNAARGAAGTALEDAASIAARDAGLLARCLVVADVLDPVHLAHARARWDVWQRGYGLAGDIDGVLYVYRRIS